MSERIRDADADALSPEDESILRHLDRYYPISLGVAALDHALELRCSSGLQALAQRNLVERVIGGWRITPSGRRAIGARPRPPRRRGDGTKGGGRP